MSDFLFRGSLAEVDPAVFDLVQVEAERQYRKLILIPSESAAPQSIREAMGSVFQNIYAEGYPEPATRWMKEEEILSYPERLGEFHRYGDPRFYKGVEYADIIEALARRRCAEVFATNGVSADDLYVNVQALSGAPANNAVYHALLTPGDTLMGMNLFHGGHLTHGSPANRSGKLYNAVHYTIDPATEQLDYSQIQELASQHKPKIIVVGYSSYPWAVNWDKFRKIADSVKAILMADIAHVAGMVAAGAYPSPVGYADVITFTTHKTLCGPRGAAILTTDESLSKKIDKAVFPGEQGGPHVHIFAALAVTFKLAATQQFHDLQHQIVKNTKVFTERLREHGFRIAYGGSDTHLMNLDVKSIKGPDGATLTGEQAARILDLAGIVVNRNTIPGDTSALNPTGLRMASPWVTQRGFKETEMTQLADIIADLLKATTPYRLPGKGDGVARVKVDFLTLEHAKTRVRSLAEQAGIDYTPQSFGYPHFHYFDDGPTQKSEWVTLEISGDHARQFLNYVLASEVEALKPTETQPTSLGYFATSKANQYKFTNGMLTCITPIKFNLSLPKSESSVVAAWLRDLSDGYIGFDEDILRKLPGPIRIVETPTITQLNATPSVPRSQKPYFIGQQSGQTNPSLPEFAWQEPVSNEIKRTPVNEFHRSIGAKMIPFAGWDMPVWYSSVVEEHLAVRQAAGLFDVSHMGVYQAEGSDACAFLDSVCGNDIASLAVGESLYTHFLDPHSNVIDDLMVYRRSTEKYLVVVNAANDDKDWAWLNAVKDGAVMVDTQDKGARAFGRGVILRNLRDEKQGNDMRVDIALQGPRSRDILFALGCNEDTRKRIKKLTRTQLCEGVVGGFDLVISRTGYTGERMAFELFVHPTKASALFAELLKAGEPYGIKPCGLAARDSLRTEAGLPLYGHEMGGELNLGVGEAGFSSYVKVYKPWFIGRTAFINREKQRGTVVARFRFTEKGIRPAHLGDPVLEKRGKVIGTVTSCAIDKEGLLTGQALVDIKYAEENTPVFIFPSAPEQPGIAPAKMHMGDKTALPSAAIILTRFPK